MTPVPRHRDVHELSARSFTVLPLLNRLERYSDHMNHLGVLRNKIGLLRVEIADIQELNQQFRLDGGNGTGVQVAHGQRSERLQGIQHELTQLAELGHRVVSTAPMKEEHRSRPHTVKQKRAA
jgi:hypothetical protein